jgi:hypothetical protein
MPLMAKVLPALERVREQSGSRSLNTDAEEHYDSEIDDFQERDDEEMSDVSILNQPRLSKTIIPAVPPRSELRASRIFENLTIELEALEKAALEEKLRGQLVESDPYKSYLSSEEEGSESADEFDESIVELDSDRPPSSRASSRCSHEDTARVVSFMFVGKPQLVEVASHDRPASLKRRSTDRSVESRESRRRPSPLRLIPNITGSSTLSTRTSSLAASSKNLPLRLYTHPAAAASTLSVASKHSFLQSDPFPTPNPNEVEKVSSSSDAFPKTPTSINAAWKGSILGVTRTLGKAAKKRPSMPKLSLAYTSTSPRQPSGTPTTATPNTATPKSASSPLPRPSQDQGPVNYQDILRNAIRGPPPTSPNLKTKTSGLLGMARRRSIKG